MKEIENLVTDTAAEETGAVFSKLSESDNGVVMWARSLATDSDMSVAYSNVTSAPTETEEKPKTAGPCCVSSLDIEALHPDLIRSLPKSNYVFKQFPDDACSTTTDGPPSAISKSNSTKDSSYRDKPTIGVYRDGKKKHPRVMVVYRNAKGNTAQRARIPVVHGTFSDWCTANLVCNWLSTQSKDVWLTKEAGRRFVEYLVPGALKMKHVGRYVSVSRLPTGGFQMLEGNNESDAVVRTDVIWGNRDTYDEVSGQVSAKGLSTLHGSGMPVVLVDSSSKRAVEKQLINPISSMAAVIDWRIVEQKMKEHASGSLGAQMDAAMDDADLADEMIE